MQTICSYCNSEPIATDIGWKWSCQSCSYVCLTCQVLTPYELGGTDSPICDPCWAQLNEIKENQERERTK